MSLRANRKCGVCSKAQTPPKAAIQKQRRRGVKVLVHVTASQVARQNRKLVAFTDNGGGGDSIQEYTAANPY
jgi:hypothetical protein